MIKCVRLIRKVSMVAEYVLSFLGRVTMLAFDGKPKAFNS